MPFSPFAKVIVVSKTLVIAEKPSVGRDLAATLPGAFKQSQDKTHLVGGDYVITWAVGFAALALFAAPARRVAGSLRAGLKSWAANRRLAEQDRLLWETALTDARVMADLSRAMSAEAARDIRTYY